MAEYQREYVGVRPPEKWEKFHLDVMKLNVAILSDDGPIGPVFGFTNPEESGRIPYLFTQGRTGVAVRVGSVVKVDVTRDGRNPFDDL